VILWLLAAMAAPCALDGPADAPFMVAAPDDGSHVHVVVVLRLADGELEWAAQILSVLEERGLHAGLLVSRAEPSESMRSFVLAAMERGHEVVVRLAEEEVAKSPEKGPAQMRKRLKVLSSSYGKVRVAEAPLGTRESEGILHRVGLRAVLETNGASTAAPRKQAHFEGQPDSGVVLPIGPYSGPCGTDPSVSGFTPLAADRVTQAVYGARSARTGVVRLRLLAGEATDAAVLARWLDTVILPAGVSVGPPGEAREVALKALRSGEPVDWNPDATAGGRLVRVDEVKRAAESLLEVNTVPRELPGELSPTEAFQAFLRVLAGEVEGSVVRLSALDGPALLSRSQLDGPTPVRPESLRKLSVALLAELPASIPAALSVDGQLLNAAELLVVLAAAVAEVAPVARPVAVPEPSAVGLGWGRATTP